MRYTTRTLTDRHAAQVAFLGGTDETAYELARLDGEHFVGAFHGDKLIGYTRWKAANALGHRLVATQVQTDHRGQGASRAMQNHSVDQIASPLVDYIGSTMELDIPSDDQAGIKAFKRQGWTMKPTWQAFTPMTRPLGTI